MESLGSRCPKSIACGVP
uniref:Uncharacterized protein n=1 Tax=Arundo donax TaxID=35708 RepID=A0A0A9FHT1_ARUDO